jgi:hypothetical protein
MEDGQVDAGMALVQRFAAQRVSPGFRGNPFDDRYAILALRFAPEHSAPLIEQALVSGSPSSLKRIGSLLSVLDAPWCREHLLRAARINTNPSSIRFLVGCLMHSNDGPTRETAKLLLPPPPALKAGQIGYTYEEVTYLNLRKEVTYHRSRAQELADRLRPH